VGGAYIEAGATANDVCDGDLTDAITRDASDVNTNEPGAYEVVYRVADASGNTAVATRTVEVIAPPAVPVITVGSGPQTLAKADGKYKNVALGQLRLSVSDASDPALSADQVVIVAVWSDEPEIGAGDATRNDIVIAADCRSVKLRAERRNAGNGRVYTLLLEVTNRSGLTGTATHQIFVPVDRSHQAFDDGAVAGHTVTGNCGT
jgi:hypothetical protein